MRDGEIRQNKATKQWVIYAPSRRMRPRDFAQPEEKAAELPEFVRNCPFCPGHDSLLPSILSETRDDEGRWTTRVVPNKYPALVPGKKMDRECEGIYVVMPGVGRHDVIIETPLHNRHPALMDPSEVDMVVETYHRRYTELLRECENMMIIIFRNHGERAGTSLAHPHSQLIATAMVPHHVRRREEEAERYFDEWGRCVYCDMLRYELEDGRRVFLENDVFTAFVPYAADVPFEIWIMPKEHKADFGDITDKEKSAFSSALNEVLTRLHDRLNNPDYNYVINTSAQYRANEPQLHWYMQILPRLTTIAGFEIGSGISINPSIPEEDAAYLRETE